MNFGGWFPLHDATSAAPSLPGLLQARGDALSTYPRGKSAMLLYAGSRADETLKEYVRTRGAKPLARAAGIGARWVRFGTSPAPDADLDRLLRRFDDRFGAKPAANLDEDTLTTT